MEHEGDSFINRDLCFWYSYQRIIRETRGLGGRGMSGDDPNNYIIENGQNTEKSPGDLRRLAFTQTSSERPSTKTDVKNSQVLDNNNNNNNVRHDWEG